jgi:hypothetical protein
MAPGRSAGVPQVRDHTGSAPTLHLSHAPDLVAADNDLQCRAADAGVADLMASLRQQASSCPAWRRDRVASVGPAGPWREATLRSRQRSWPVQLRLDTVKLCVVAFWL